MSDETLPVGTAVEVDGCAGEFVLVAPDVWNNSWTGEVKDDDVLTFTLTALAKARAELAKFRALAVQARATKRLLEDPHQTQAGVLRALDMESHTHSQLAALDAAREGA